MPETTIARRLLIRGRVQGVSFRANAQAEAERLGLSGWVRNRMDGSVEALVSGPQQTVEQFMAWARKGPRAARVDEVEFAEVEPPEPGPFSVRPTA